MRAWAIGVTALCLCALMGCGSGIEYVKRPEDARERAQLLKARAIGIDRQIAVEKEKVKRMAQRIKELQARKKRLEAELEALEPQIELAEEEMEEAEGAVRAYRRSILNDMEDREFYLETQIGQQRENIDFYAYQKAQIERHIEDLKADAEALREDADGYIELAAEIEEREARERRLAEQQRMKEEKKAAEAKKKAEKEAAAETGEEPAEAEEPAS